MSTIKMWCKPERRVELKIIVYMEEFLNLLIMLRIPNIIIVCLVESLEIYLYVWCCYFSWIVVFA